MAKTRLHGAWLRNLWATLTGSPRSLDTGVDLDTMMWSVIAPDAELIAFFEQHPAPVAADTSDLPSAVSSYLAAAKMSLLVPLVAQRQLVGLLSLGPPVTGGAYSADDFVFLSTLADEAAGAARIIRLLDDDARSQSPAGNLNGLGGVSSPTSS